MIAITPSRRARRSRSTTSCSLPDGQAARVLLDELELAIEPPGRRDLVETDAHRFLEDAVALRVVVEETDADGRGTRAGDHPAKASPGRERSARLRTRIGAPPRGRFTTMPTGSGMVVPTACTSRRWASRAMISVNSICASAKPMQLRAPRPNGTHAVSAIALRSSSRPTKRSGSNDNGSGHASRIASGQVRRPEDQRALRDPVAADRQVGCCFAWAQDAGRVEPQCLAHDAVRELEPRERRVIRGR